MTNSTPRIDSGWMTDLTPEELQNLIGATVTLFQNLKAVNGLLIKIEDGTAYLFRSDQVHPFLVAGTRFERTPGPPLRPTLARALVHKRQWDEKSKSLQDKDGNPLNQHDYDKALSAYEESLPDIHEWLLIELATQLFPTTRKDNA